MDQQTRVGKVRNRGSSFQVDFPTAKGRHRKDFADEGSANAYLLALQSGAVKLAGEGSSLATIKDAFERTKTDHWAGLRSWHKLELNGQLAVDFFGADKLLVEITEDEVARYRDHVMAQGRSASTVSHRLQALSNMLKVAKAQRAITAVPSVKRPRQVLSPPRFLSDAEERLLLAWLTAAEYRETSDLCAVLLDTGLRVAQECLPLTRADLRRHTDGRLLVYVADPKGRAEDKKPRTVPATARAQRILLEREQAAIAAGRESLWTQEYWAVRRHFDRARAALKWGDDVTLHTLRHTCASRLVQRGVDLFRVQSWMGHRDLDTTRRYSHLLVDHLIAGAEALEA